MLYDYQCGECGSVTEKSNTVADRLVNAPECCGGKMSIVILTAPLGYVDNMAPYRCPVTNEGVTTRTRRNEIMARKGLVDANDLLQTNEQRRKKQEKVDRLRDESRAKPKELTEQVNAWAEKQVYG